MESDRLRQALGELHGLLLKNQEVRSLHDAEFKVFSQWGEDGIIQHLLSRVDISSRSFIEIGVGDYRESNTRFLLGAGNWRGLIIDSGDAHIRFVTESGLRWKYELDALSHFITRENVNDVLGATDFVGDIDLFSLDVDGNEYWILQALTVVEPRILIVEYNSLLGDEHFVTVPYDAGFRRDEAHHSWLYYGASLPALTRLLNERNYALVGTNSAGNNAFYVRRDLLGTVIERSPQDVFVPRRFRESRNEDGELSYVSSAIAQLRLMAAKPLLDVISGREILIRDLYELD